MSKSSETSSARRSFVNSYSKTTMKVVSLVQRGWTSQRIADSLGLSRTSVTTCRANYTRGVYAPYAFQGANGPTGTCNFTR